MKKDNRLNRRFITYTANLIYYNSINYDKKRRIKDNIFPLTLDNDENLESIFYACYDSESIPPNLKDHNYRLFNFITLMNPPQRSNNRYYYLLIYKN